MKTQGKLLDIRITCVANTVRATDKSLEGDVRDELAEGTLYNQTKPSVYKCLQSTKLPGLTRRSQGSSYKNLIATSNVAPPHISNANAFCNAQLVSFAMFTMSIVRRRVASNDWCASRHVVSMMSTPGYSRTAFANASGPFSMMMLRQPFWQGTEQSRGGPFSGSSRFWKVGTTMSSLRPGSP